MTEKLTMEPDLSKLFWWEVYSNDLMIEYRQSMEAGLDMEAYHDVFEAVAALPLSPDKEKMADVLFHIVSEAKTRPDYAYCEPDGLEEIRAGRNPALTRGKAAMPGDEVLRDKLLGAWYGRICGCLLGKPIEGIRRGDLRYLLSNTDNFPMHRYIRASEITDEIQANVKFNLKGRCFADTVSIAPVDDDTNYTVLYQDVVEKFGRNFTPDDVAKQWLTMQPKDAYCTAERVAFVNFVKGYYPPASASYKNPYREWIGAQIRGDYFGYINPGDPELAAEMAWRDACISHTANGIYGEMFVAAMLAAAAVTDDITEILKAGLGEIPAASRLYEAVMKIIDGYHSGVSAEDFFADFHKRWDDACSHDWCHTISNAEIVTAALLYGEGDYRRSVCLAVQQAFDTDCNGATVGSVLGMRNGADSIPDDFKAPIHGRLSTSIVGYNTVSLDELAERTRKHIPGQK